MEGQKKAAMFFDIDGTLVSDITESIPESAIKALKMAKENGHEIFINTGRTLCSVSKGLVEIGFDGLLCGCGTYILYHGKELLDLEIPEKRGYELVDMMFACGMTGILEGNTDIYLPREVTEYKDIEDIRRRRAPWGLGLKKHIEDKDYRYDKIYVGTDEKSDKERFFDFVKEDMDIVDRRNGMYEIIQKGYSKATAIEVIRKYLGLSMDQIYVFGDSSNDIEMFRYADHAIAMGCHDEVLDQYTEYVADTVENDGIYKAMEHYGLI